jgi:hypothetical protein
MLIDEAIDEGKRAQRLFPVRPLAPWSPSPRVFLMCVPLRDAIAAGRESGDAQVRQRWAALEAAMSLFVEGGYVTEKVLKQLLDYKHEHWEL